MGKIEREVKIRHRKANLKKAILVSVALAGILGMAAVAPNVFGALAKLGIIPHARQKEAINRSRDRLIKRGFLERRGQSIRLTTKGEAALRQLESSDYALRKPRHWDGSWRVLIFDVPERRRGTRDRLRQTLIAMGFARVQDSVWIYPYDCEDLITLFKADFKIGKDLLYLVVENMEGDRHYKKLFGLNR